jgi:predicted acyltransferase
LKPFEIFGPAFEPLLFGAVMLAIYWLMLLWMFRRKVFLRI